MWAISRTGLSRRQLKTRVPRCWSGSKIAQPGAKSPCTGGIMRDVEDELVVVVAMTGGFSIRIALEARGPRVLRMPSATDLESGRTHG